MGRPRRPIDADRVLALARQGHSMRAIARITGYPLTTLYRRTLDPPLSWLWDKRRVETLAMIALRALF